MSKYNRDNLKVGQKVVLVKERPRKRFKYGVNHFMEDFFFFGK